MVKKILNWIDFDITPNTKLVMIILARCNESIDILKYCANHERFKNIFEPVRRTIKNILKPRKTVNLLDIALEFDVIDLIKNFCYANRQFCNNKLESITEKCAKFNSLNIYKFIMDEFDLSIQLIKNNLIVAIANDSHDIAAYLMPNYGGDHNKIY